METGEESSHQNCAEFEEIAHGRETGTESVPCQDAEDAVGEELEINEAHLLRQYHHLGKRSRWFSQCACVCL